MWREGIVSYAIVRKGMPVSGDKMSENNDNGDQFNTDTRNTDDKCDSIVSGTGKRGGMTCGDDDACDDKRDAAGFAK